MKTTQYVRLEKAIAAADRGTIHERWMWGRALLADPEAFNPGSSQLKPGRADRIVAAAKAAGIKLSEREIRSRLQCARTYSTEGQIRQVAAEFPSWTALVAKSFPPVEPDGSDPDDLEAEGFGEPPDSWEQLQLDIPGIKPVISVRGRPVRLVRGADGAKVADVTVYRERCVRMHESFGKTVDQMRESERIMLLGAAGDETMNAVEAYERGLALDPGSEGAPGQVPSGGA